MNINATLFVEIIVFGSFVELTRRYIWPPIIDILDQRQAEVNQGIEDAKHAKKTLALAEEEHNRVLSEAKAQCKQLIAQAEHTVQEMLEDAKAEGKVIREKHLDEAKALVDKQLHQEKQALESHTLSFVENVLHKVIVKLPDQPQLNTMIDQAIGETNVEES